MNDGVEKVVEIGQLHQVESVLRTKVGGEDWLQWKQSLRLRMRMASWLKDVPLDLVLEVIAELAEDDTGTVPFWAAFWERLDQRYGRCADNKDDQEDRAPRT